MQGSANKPLSGRWSGPVLLPLSLQVARSLAEEEINGKMVFGRRTPCLEPTSHCECHSYAPHSSSKKGAEIHELGFTVGLSLLRCRGHLAWLTPVGHLGSLSSSAEGTRRVYKSAWWFPVVPRSVPGTQREPTRLLWVETEPTLYRIPFSRFSEVTCSYKWVKSTINTTRNHGDFLNGILRGKNRPIHGSHEAAFKSRGITGSSTLLLTSAL